MKKLVTLVSFACVTALSQAQSWTDVNTNLPALSARGLAKIGDTLLVGIRGGGVYYSVTNGDTWQEHHTSALVDNSGMNKFYGSKAAVGDDAYFFVLGNGNVQYYELNNGLYNLNNLTSQLGTSEVISYEKSENPGTHFFGTPGGLYSFADGVNPTMVTATGLDGDAGVVYSVFDNDNSQILAGTMAGLYVSNDNGVSFTLNDASIPANTKVNEIAIFTLTGNGVYFFQQQGPTFLPIVQGGDYRCYYWDMMGSGNAVMFGNGVGSQVDANFTATDFDLTGVSGGPILGTVMMGEYVFVCTQDGGVFRYGTNAAPEAPVAPTNLMATVFKTQSNYVELSWTDNSANEDGFDVERSTDGQSFTSIGTVAADVLNFQDNNLSPLTTYYYRVLAYNSVGNSDPSNVVEITTDASVGIANPDFSVGRMFPNPVNDILWVECSEAASLIICDMNGRELVRAALSASLNQMDVSDLPPGVYSITLRTAHNQTIGRLLKF